MVQRYSLFKKLLETHDSAYNPIGFNYSHVQNEEKESCGLRMIN
jgi:hypothetical protein